MGCKYLCMGYLCIGVFSLEFMILGNRWFSKIRNWRNIMILCFLNFYLHRVLLWFLKLFLSLWILLREDWWCNLGRGNRWKLSLRGLGIVWERLLRMKGIRDFLVGLWLIFIDLLDLVWYWFCMTNSNTNYSKNFIDLFFIFIFDIFIIDFTYINIYF